ncbi:MAG: GNAT family N-acetyltransferase [Tagaea sp.]|nr:GNAT family N-acetyltransferase [Tagaea sp.]
MKIVADPDRKIWAQAAEAAAFFPLQQDWEYGLAARWHGRDVRRFVALRDDRPVACLQIVGRRWLGFFDIWAGLRGPVGDPQAWPGLAARVPGWPFAASLLSPETTADAATRARWLGRGRVYTGTTLALWRLDAAGEKGLLAGMHQKWRNRLRAAERSGLRVELAPRGKWVEWVLAQGEAVRKAKGFEAAPPEFVARLAELKGGRECLVAVALDKREPVAGALFLRHGRDATYYVAASTPQGRARNAANLVLWRAALALKEAGVRGLDLGTVETERSAGLARFKLGTGAEPCELAGTYL